MFCLCEHVIMRGNPVLGLTLLFRKEKLQKKIAPDEDTVAKTMSFRSVWRNLGSDPFDYAHPPLV